MALLKNKDAAPAQQDITLARLARISWSTVPFIFYLLALVTQVTQPRAAGEGWLTGATFVNALPVFGSLMLVFALVWVFVLAFIKIDDYTTAQQQKATTPRT